MGTLEYSARIEVEPAAENNGLAQMISGLILQNLQERPEKRVDFARLRGRFAIVAQDAGVALTLEFTGNMLTVYDGIAGIPDITVRASSEDIVQMSLLELTPLWGLPNLFTPSGRAFLQKTQTGRVRVYGGLLHVGSLLRLTRLLSVL
jgi:hypothetical protein